MNIFVPLGILKNQLCVIYHTDTDIDTYIFDQFKKLRKLNNNKPPGHIMLLQILVLLITGMCTMLQMKDHP